MNYKPKSSLVFMTVLFIILGIIIVGPFYLGQFSNIVLGAEWVEPINLYTYVWVYSMGALSLMYLCGGVVVLYLLYKAFTMVFY